MKKVKLALEPSIHKNDCWAHVLKRILVIPYEEAYSRYKHLAYADGSLDHIFCDREYRIAGFYSVPLNLSFNDDRAYYNTLLRVQDVATIFDSINNDIIISTKDHVCFLSKNTIYSNAQNNNIHLLNELLLDEVLSVYIKPKTEL